MVFIQSEKLFFGNSDLNAWRGSGTARLHLGERGGASFTLARRQVRDQVDPGVSDRALAAAS